MPRVMHASFFRGEERAFEMKAEHAWLSVRQRVDRRHSRAHLGRAVTNQRWQQGRGAEPAVRRYDRADGLGRWRVIEQNVAAAIDLNIDKARRQPEAFRQIVY